MATTSATEFNIVQYLSLSLNITLKSASKANLNELKSFLAAQIS